MRRETTFQELDGTYHTLVEGILNLVSRGKGSVDGGADHAYAEMELFTLSMKSISSLSQWGIIRRPSGSRRLDVSRSRNLTGDWDP